MIERSQSATDTLSTRTLGKTILVEPEEVVFRDVVAFTPYKQKITLKNTLSAPVDLVLKSSNGDRLTVTPQAHKLAPHETCQVELTLKQNKPFPAKASKQKEAVLFKSDFFDQKVVVWVLPACGDKNTTASSQGDQSSGRMTKTSNSLQRATSGSRSNIELAGDSFGRSNANFGEKTADLGADFERDIPDDQNGLKQQLESLNAENQKLRGLLESLQQRSASQSVDSDAHLDKIKELLSDKEPKLEELLDEALRYEKQNHEKKDAKVLEILQFKDRQIEEMERKIHEMNAQIIKVTQECQDTRGQLIMTQDKLETANQKASLANRELSETNSKLSQFQNSNAFQSMLENQSQQEFIKEMGNQIQSLKLQLSDKNQAELIYEQAIKKAKDEIANQDKDIDLLKLENDQLQLSNQKLEATVEHLREQNEKLTQGMLQDKSDRSLHLQQDKQLLNRIDKLEAERDQLSSRLKASESNALAVYKTLGRVCGSDPESSQKLLKSSQMSSTAIGLDEKLLCRAEEIVLIVEQVQQQYTLLEQELRGMVQKQKDDASVQTAVDEINNNVEEQNQNLREMLQDSKFEIDRLNEIIRVHGVNNSVPGLVVGQTADLWTMQKSSIGGEDLINIDDQVHHPYSSKEDNTSVSDNQSTKALSQKIKQMKAREQHLLEQLSFMKNQLRLAPSGSGSDLPTQPNRSTSIGDHQGLRIAELEAVIFQQRDQLLKLEEEQIVLKRKLSESQDDQQNQIELLKLRNSNLQELSKKFETDLNKKLISQTSVGDVIGSFQSPMSLEHQATGVETERMRQQAQQLELQNMDLKHKLSELIIINDQTTKQKDSLKEELDAVKSELVSSKHDKTLFNAGIMSGESRMAVLVQEQRSRIKALETQIRNYQLQNGVTTSQNVSVSDTGVSAASNPVAATNLTSGDLFNLKEEYATKLEHLIEKHQQERSNLQNQVIIGNQKVEQLMKKFGFMEEKELKLMSQLEEAKKINENEEGTAKARLKNIEELLEAKNQTVIQLERQLKQKEGVLAERQEQLSILLTAMESQSSAGMGQSSGDPQMQKISNLAAELCSLKAVEAQLEKRASDATHEEKRVQLQNHQLQSELTEAKQRYQTLQKKINSLESENEKLDRSKHESLNQISVLQRDASDSKYRYERLLFQIKLKEETIVQLKEQIKRGEQYFKDQVNQIKTEMINREPPSTSFNKRGSLPMGSISEGMDSNSMYSFSGPRREVGLKLAVQSLHLVIADYIERAHSNNAFNSSSPSEYQGADEAQKNIIFEMEKALQVASQTIQRLEQDLDKERFKTVQLKNEWDATALNSVLITRHEKLVAQIQSLEKVLETREQEQSREWSQQSESYNRIIKELENKVESLESERLEEELEDARDQIRQLKISKDELESRVLNFHQEMQNQKATLERKAEIAVDERYKSKHEAIKTYFDSQITKLLISSSQGQIDKHLDFGREICALQLMIDKQQQANKALQAEKEGLETSLNFYKDQLNQEQSTVQSLRNKLESSHKTQQTLDSQVKIDLEKRKQENLRLEKELIKVKDMYEQKSRESILASNRLESRSTDNILQAPQGLPSLASQDHLNAKIQSLQEQLMEIRGQHIQELEEMKQEYELEVAERRREMSLQQTNFEKRFLPGTAPGEILDANHELREKVDKLVQDIDSLEGENNGLRQQINQIRSALESLQFENQAYKKTFEDLEAGNLNQLQHGSLTQSMNTNNPFILTQDGSRSAKKSILKQSTAKKSVDTLSQEPAHFTVNPPILVKALLFSKLHENLLKESLLKQVEQEIEQRKLLTQTLQEQEGDQIGSLIVQLMESNHTLQSAFHQLQKMPKNEHQENPEEVDDESDYGLLIQAILYLTNQISSKEHKTHDTQSTLLQTQSVKMLDRVSSDKIVEAQRVVIRSLSSKLYGCEGVKYLPERSEDKKIWYLELLEQQVSDAEDQTTKLQDFIKKLQIGVSGNLQSAAEIRAMSMDLAQHLKEASDEIKTLRHVAGLIKHDVQNIQADKPTYNPFSTQGDLKNDGVLTSRTNASNVDGLMSQIESTQNQLSVTNKVKQSLEQELVSTKLQHSKELETLIKKFSEAEKALCLITQEQTILKKQKEALQTDNQALRDQLKTLEEQMEDLNKEHDREVMSHMKSKDTSKHLSKLQQDMQEWRKQSEHNMHLKQEQLKQVQDQLDKVTAERSKLKSEIAMLRKSQKAIRGGELAESLQKENQILKDKLSQQIEERKQEIEFWVQERGQMRDKIEELQALKTAGGGLIGKSYKDVVEEAPVDEKSAVKIQKKLKNKEYELKKRDKEVVSLKDEITKLQLAQVTFENQIRDLQSEKQVLEEKLKLNGKRFKEVELECQMVKDERKNLLEQNGQEALQIAAELDSLRENFAKLKLEKEELKLLLDANQAKEQEWKNTITRLNQEIASLEGNYVLKDQGLETQVKTLEQKNSVLVSDLKFLRQENEKMQQKCKETQAQILQMDAQMGDHQQDYSQLALELEDQRRKTAELESLLKKKDNQIASVETELQANEADYFNKIKQLQTSLQNLRQDSVQAQQMMSAQVQQLKQKLVSDKKLTSREADGILQVTQKDSMIKQLKKELAQSKSKVTQLKSKNTELKENQQVLANQVQTSKKQALRNLPRKQSKESLEKDLELQLTDKLNEIEGFKKLLSQTKKVNLLEAQIAESQATATKFENMNYVLENQLEVEKDQVRQLQDQISDLQDRVDRQTSKKASETSNKEKQLKDQVKNLQADIMQMKEEWLAPSNSQQLVDQIHTLQQQVKSLQSDLSRKSKLLTNFRTNKQQKDFESEQLVQDLAGLKDDNSKLQRVVKDTQKIEKQVREYRQQNEWLVKQEKGLKSEIVAQNDKIKQLKNDLIRKDQICKEFKDKLEFIQAEVNSTQNLKTEISRLKEAQKKHKLDIEIKDNQVKSLKQRIGQQQEDFENLTRSNIRSQESMMETQLKTSKQKVRKYESYLRKSLGCLKKISVELAACNQSQNAATHNELTAALGISNKKGKDEPMLMSELQKDEQYYQEGAEVLGLSMQELGMFMDPTSSQATHKKPPQSSSKKTNAASCVSSQGIPLTRDPSNAALLEKLDKIDSIPESLNQDIEQIGDYCIKLIGDMTSIE